MLGEMISANFGAGVLLVPALVMLKTCKAIAWSWWWVLSPVWASVGLSFLLVSGCLAFCLPLPAAENGKIKVVPFDNP